MKNYKNKQKTASTEHSNTLQLISRKQGLREATFQFRSTLKDAIHGNLLLAGAAFLFTLRGTQQAWKKIRKKKNENNLPCQLKDSPEYTLARNTLKDSASGAWQDNKELIKKNRKDQQRSWKLFLENPRSAWF